MAQARLQDRRHKYRETDVFGLQCAHDFGRTKLTLDEHATTTGQRRECARQNSGVKHRRDDQAAFARLKSASHADLDNVGLDSTLGKLRSLGSTGRRANAWRVAVPDGTDAVKHGVREAMRTALLTAAEGLPH